jgi:L-glyceraldehyde 3-phosphate reductase
MRTDGHSLNASVLNDALLAKIGSLNKLAEGRGQTLAQMALAWLFKNEAVTSVLIGASKPEQILDDLKMLSNTNFTQEELQLIDSIAG